MFQLDVYNAGIFLYNKNINNNVMLSEHLYYKPPIYKLLNHTTAALVMVDVLDCVSLKIHLLSPLMFSVISNIAGRKRLIFKSF